jgi:hypothetical protein
MRNSYFIDPNSFSQILGPGRVPVIGANLIFLTIIAKKHT